jgi:eukaryotic-like serine/threonine-protein kinase
MGDPPPRRPAVPPNDIEALETLDKVDAPTLDSRSARPRAGGEAGLAPGRALGRYRLVRVLGRGGFGQVWEAEDTSSGRRVAIKVLSEKHASNLDRQRFEREGRLAASVSHPNCVYVFAAEEIEERPTIVMELVPGGTLQELLKASGPLPVARAVDYALDILDGLDAAHQRGVIHRDVKPSNCFLDAEGRAKIGDFGLSRTLEVDTHLTATGTFAGTPAYSSPEQVKARDLDFRTDLYSLGATLYSLLTGKAPFEGTQLGAVLSQILTEDPPPVVTHGVQVPKGLEAAVLRLMAKDPGKRFPTYAAARAALVPYSSRGLGPASVARRIGAALVDTVLLMPLVLLSMVTSPDPAAPRLVVSLAAFVYYLLLEKLWGKSLGKHAFRLEVTSATGRDTTWGQILLRTTVYCGISVAIALASWLVGEDAFVWHFGRVLIRLDELGPLLWLGVLASTLRRRNGYAGLHEVLSATRVQGVPEADRAERPGTEEKHALIPVEVSAVGPFDILGAHWVRENESLLAGRDPVLGREVLVFRFADQARSSPSVSVGSLRWLQGGEGWNAYEKPGGSSLWSWVRRRGRLSYAEAHRVLVGVLEGLSSRGTGSVLSLTRIWVEPSGRARWLDFDALDLPPEDSPGTFSAESWRSFLKQVLVFALEGVAVPQIAVPVPEHARPLVAGILAGECGDSPATLLASLREAASRPSSVGTARRAAAMAIPAHGVVFATVIVTITFLTTPFIAANIGLQSALEKWRELAPVPAPVSGDPDTRDAQRIAAVELWLSYELARAESLARVSLPVMHAPALLEQTLAELSPAERAGLVEVRARYPAPTDEEVAVARAFLKRRSRPTETRIAALILALSAATLVVLSLLSALVLRGGLGLRVSGITAQRRDGAPAGRLRCLWRAGIAWAPLLVLALLGYATFSQDVLSRAALVTVALAGGACFTAGATYALLRPHRGIQDRLAGTVLMPR